MYIMAMLNHENGQHAYVLPLLGCSLGLVKS